MAFLCNSFARPIPPSILDLHGLRSQGPVAVAMPAISSPRGRLTKTILVVAAAAAGGGKRYKGTVVREEMLAEMIERKVAEAMAACEGDERKGSDGCRVAWDEVEEVSRAKALLRRADPLEPFCKQNPASDECLIVDSD